MPFDVMKAAAHIRRVVIKFNQEKLELHYNAGEKYREYQKKAQKLDQEHAELTRDLTNATPGPGASDEAKAAADQAYKELLKALDVGRRNLADNICTVIEDWDLEGDLDAIKESMAEKDRKHYKGESGYGKIPISGAWLDALPLPDAFILKIADAITNDFDTGGAGGKAR